jgi:uncharacterized membrane protein YkoI
VFDLLDLIFDSFESDRIIRRSCGRLLSIGLCLSSITPLRADFRRHAITAPMHREKEEGGFSNGATSEILAREIKRFGSAEISLPRALIIANQCHSGARIVDISFDAIGSASVYRVRAVKGSQIWENTIDATTGQIKDVATEFDVGSLQTEDRKNLAAFGSVSLEIADAIPVAERNAAGRAISGGLMMEDGKLNFVIVVVSGNDLKQVTLQRPAAEDRRAGR